MTPNRTGILISLTLHGGAIALAFALGGSIAQPGKQIEIDFTLVEPAGPPLPGPPPLASKPKPGPPAPRSKPPTPVTKRSRSFAQQQAPVPREPATQPQGSVPVFADPDPAPPAPVQQASSQSATGSGGGGGSPSGSAQGSGGGGGISADKLRKQYLAEHYAYIMKLIQANVVYPERAKRLRWTGTCIVQFVVLGNGHTKDIRVLKSTGYELLDDNIVDTIKKVEPFPKPPVTATVKILFTYGLD